MVRLLESVAQCTGEGGPGLCTGKLQILEAVKAESRTDGGMDGSGGTFPNLLR